MWINRAFSKEWPSYINVETEYLICGLICSDVEFDCDLTLEECRIFILRESLNLLYASEIYEVGYYDRRSTKHGYGCI